MHATPYSESSVVAKVFTRHLGLRSYIIKGVRGRSGKVKQNLLQPLSALDMVVYDNPRTELNYIKEISPRHPEAFMQQDNHAVAHSLRFFMTEVLYKALREAEPMPALFDYVEESSNFLISNSQFSFSQLPISFLLTVSRHLGIEPLDNCCPHEALFDLHEGRFVSTPTETTLSPHLSETLHHYLNSPLPTLHFPLDERTALINALIAYYHLHLSGFDHFHSHEILHTILK